MLGREYDLTINKKKVYRMLDDLDMLQPQRRKRMKYPRRLANTRVVDASNQLWEMDIKYGYIAGEHRFFFLLGVIDVFDRELVDYHFGLSCDGKHAAALIQRALWKRRLFDEGTRPVIRTDNGPQFICRAFEEACLTHQIEHERIPPKTPNKNAHIEAFHSLLESECLQRYEIADYADAHAIVTDYISFYNERRMHGSLRDFSPMEYRKKIEKGELQPIMIKV